METPICDFVEKYAREGNLRLHMPGHKGVPFLGVEDRDITEVEGADVLYGAEGIIAESQKNASSLFGSAKTLYSTEGSSLCIRAMVYLLSAYAKGRGKRPLILAARNAHKTFMSALALLDVDVEWLYPESGDNLISCRVSADRIENRFEEMAELPSAVYLTSPDYLGAMADMEAIAKVCHKHRVLLIVDNAHGAYLRFLPESRHPLDLGCDLCCDSAHKTLPVLTGGAYLHISENAPACLGEMAEQAMALFASTSPSYLILQSLDLANRYLAEGYRERLARLSERIVALKRTLSVCGYSLIGDETMKLCIDAKRYGYRGTDLAEMLSEKGIVCEFADKDFTVMMFTPEVGLDGIGRLEAALSAIPKRARIEEKAPSVGIPEKKMTVREAMLSPSCEISTKDAAGRVLASANVSCPPAIPIVICGEAINEEALRCFEYYGISKCRVVKEQSNGI